MAIFELFKDNPIEMIAGIAIIVAFFVFTFGDRNKDNSGGRGGSGGSSGGGSSTPPPPPPSSTPKE